MKLLLQPFYFIQRGTQLFFNRLYQQGWKSALVWLYGRGIPMLTGVPLFKYSQITPQLFVGPQYRQAGKRKLESLEINSSLNLRIEFDDSAHGLALKNYCYIPVINEHAPSLEQLQQGISFIQQEIANGKKIYIHCQGGLGRAPTFAAAYLISQGLTTNEAIEKIQLIRPFIDIKPGQKEQLQKYETLQR